MGGNRCLLALVAASLCALPLLSACEKSIVQAASANAAPHLDPQLLVVSAAHRASQDSRRSGHHSEEELLDIEFDYDMDEVKVPGAIGRFALTYYYVADQPEDELTDDGGNFVSLYEARTCDVLARVSRDFAADVRMEGTGRLANGDLINWTGPCSCSASPCFRRVDKQAAWGIGAGERALQPFRSIAVDPSVIRLGTHLYIAELDGVKMPGDAPWGDYIHNGCVTAVDTGGAIDGKHIDFFVANRSHYLALQREQDFKRVTVFPGDEKCRNIDGEH